MLRPKAQCPCVCQDYLEFGLSNHQLFLIAYIAISHVRTIIFNHKPVKIYCTAGCEYICMCGKTIKSAPDLSLAPYYTGMVN